MTTTDSDALGKKLKAATFGETPHGEPPSVLIEWRVLNEVIAELEAPQPSVLKDEQETRARIIDILDECERTVYAQQKWKVAHAGLQGWLFKIDAEAPKRKAQGAGEEP